jgi:hypothetical protein
MSLSIHKKMFIRSIILHRTTFDLIDVLKADTETLLMWVYQLTGRSPLHLKPPMKNRKSLNLHQRSSDPIVNSIKYRFGWWLWEKRNANITKEQRKLKWKKMYQKQKKVAIL